MSERPSIDSRLFIHVFFSYGHACGLQGCLGARVAVRIFFCCCCWSCHFCCRFLCAWRRPSLAPPLAVRGPWPWAVALCLCVVLYLCRRAANDRRCVRCAPSAEL